MSLELWQRLKDLEKKVEGLKPVNVDELKEQLKDLENKYRMLNARVSRKSTDLDPR